MRSELATPLAWGVIFCPIARVMGELASRMAVPAMKSASETAPPEKVAANIKSGDTSSVTAMTLRGPKRSASQPPTREAATASDVMAKMEKPPWARVPPRRVKNSGRKKRMPWNAASRDREMAHTGQTTFPTFQMLEKNPSPSLREAAETEVLDQEDGIEGAEGGSQHPRPAEEGHVQGVVGFPG